MIKKNEIVLARDFMSQSSNAELLANIQMTYVRNKLNVIMNKNEVLLEIGAGSGGLCCGLNCRYIGLDPLSGNSNSKVVYGTGEKIPLKNNSVDLVIVKDAINYFENFDVVLSEVSRVLKPNAYFINSEQCGQNYSLLMQYFKIFIKKIGFKRSVWDDTYLRYYTSYDIKRTLQRNDFKVIEASHSPEMGRSWVVGQSKKC